MTDDRSLYFASTPLIALQAAGAAMMRGGRAQLVLLEDFELAGRLAALLQVWPDCPFEAVHCLPGRYHEHARGVGAGRGLGAALHRVQVKRELRRETLVTLHNIDAVFQSESVWVGNDRKVETQYALHLASQRAKSRAGRYLDDGLHTYLGRPRERPLVRRIDLLVKRLWYGSWSQRVVQLGTSPWIAESWLAFPGQAVDRDPVRLRRHLPRSWFTGRPFLRLSALAAREFAVDRAMLKRSAVVLVLPHSRQIAANPMLSKTLSEFISRSAGRGRHVAVKYHPREMHADPAGLLESGHASALPRQLPMELLLPLLPSNVLLAGEASTALLAAHWLRPDLRVFDLGISQGGYAERARSFLAHNGIPAVDGDLHALVDGTTAQAHRA